MVVLKNPAELANRLELAGADRLLLVDSPEELSSLIAADLGRSSMGF